MKHMWPSCKKVDQESSDMKLVLLSSLLLSDSSSTTSRSSELYLDVCSDNTEPVFFIASWKLGVISVSWSIVHFEVKLQRARTDRQKQFV